MFPAMASSQTSSRHVYPLYASNVTPLLTVDAVDDAPAAPPPAPPPFGPVPVGPVPVVPGPVPVEPVPP